MRAARLLPILLLVFTGCATSEELFRVTVGSAELQVEVADTPESRARGLMERASMPADQGMLFVFPESDFRAFWMRNTLIPLSIAYMDERLRILEIHDMEPLDETPVPSRFPAMFALEVNQGAFDDLGVTLGDRLVPSQALADRISRVIR